MMTVESAAGDPDLGGGRAGALPFLRFLPAPFAMNASCRQMLDDVHLALC
jgi:hypothetical protein